MPWTYIVRCRDGTYYVGSTGKEPDARVWEHNRDEDLAARYTIKRRPVVLVYVEEFARIDEAFERERQLHGWSRAKKEALIGERAGELRLLARSHGRGGATLRQAQGPEAAQGPESARCPGPTQGPEAEPHGP